ncbi:MAG: PKD domain-containing protein [Pirellulaceae bacterium]
MKRANRSWMSVILAGILGMRCLAAGVAAAEDQAVRVERTGAVHPPPSLYQKKDRLSATLLATRQRYLAWLAEQPAIRTSVQPGPWLGTPPRTAADAEILVRPSERVDEKERLANGERLWSPRKDLVDGKVVTFVTGSGETSVYLLRTLRAQRAGRLTVGIGGGDRLEVWLNGRNITLARTCLTSGRYGCTTRVDGTRVDQVLVDLDLQAGENTLLLRLIPGSEPSFYFSISPRPVPRLWEQIRRDFPPAQNPLLDLVHADWFEADGWIAAQNSQFEQAFIERSIDDCGPDGQLIRAELERLRQEHARHDNDRWLELCVKTSNLGSLRRDLQRLRAAVKDLGLSHADEYPAADLLGQLDRYDQRLSTQARAKPDGAGEATCRLMAEMAQMQRRMLVELNPLLAESEILFVKRYTYNSKHYYDDFQHISRWGGNLCVLSLANGQVRELVPQLADGVFDRYDLSFDAQRILFGHRRPKREGFRLFEIRVDGSEFRQVTYPPADEEMRIAKYGTTSTGDSFYGLMGYRFWTDDVHPCYLPDGDICFASTRSEHGVLCTPNHYLACTNLFRMSPDGSDVRPISRGALSEFTPTMMEDGRILYNRWEYVYKGIAAVQPLWLMRPDGSGGEEFYGDNITNPGVFWQARQVPGHPRLAVCIGCGHEPLGVGQVLLLDLSKEKRTPEPMIRLTPNVKTQNLRGLYQLRNGVWREDIYGPLYADPYPLSDKFFLVSCNPAARYNDQSAYEIHLLDVFGNRVPIYSDPEISCWQPMPLRPRKVPPILPSVNDRETDFMAQSNPAEASHDLEPAASPGDASATVFLSDVYQGLPGVEPGTIKYVRVMEQIPKPWAAEVDPIRDEDRRADGFGGHIAISHNAHIWVAVLRGIVPVEDDGSAYFEVPAGRNLFFQALDKDFMEVQRMRTFVSFEPGERRSCIGCHEHRTQAPRSRIALAFGRPPAKLAAQPGEVAPRPLYYPTDVQPIFDRHCVTCHHGKDPQATPDLRGEMTTLFSRSYEEILQAGLVDTIREWAGMAYSMQNAEAVGPYAHGSHRSRLVELLKADHYDAKLSREEWIKLVTWIDCGAPFYGSYYGRRNLTYRGQPDFRPVPTVESACGLAPTFPELEKVEPMFQSVDLDIGQSRKVALANGTEVTIELVGIKEKRDPVRQALRGAEVTVEVNGVRCVLPCATYHLPTEVGGVRVDCPVVDGYLRSYSNVWSIDRDARFRIWPNRGPLIRPGTFQYPVPQRWGAAGTLFDNEIGDGETAGPDRVYYHQGFDFGGADRMVPVHAATDGVVVSARGAAADDIPNCVHPRYDVVYLRDPRGWYYRYSHFDEIAPTIQVGGRVSIGQQIGVLGKEGASGGWSHLHFELIRPQENGQYGSDSMYAFLHQVYQAQNDEPVIAVARPQILGFVGQPVLLDGSRSWSAAGRQGMTYEWRFDDGTKTKDAKVEHVFSEAGQFCPTLKVTDAKGNVDYDFGKVTVADPKIPPKQRCSLHASYWPTQSIRAGDDVAFLVRSFRFQPAVGKEAWDFGDGSPLVHTQSDGAVDPHNKDGYAVTKHVFQEPGHYIVTVTRRGSDGQRAVDKLDVRVGRDFRVRS